MHRIAIFIILLFFTSCLFSQNIGINEDGSNPDPSAILDVKANDKGFLVPRLIENQKNAIINPANGLLIYQTDADSGFFYFNGALWIPILSKSIVRLIDEDDDTKIEVEQNPDEDMIRMNLRGYESLKFSKNANDVPIIEIKNAFENTVIGELAGMNLSPNGFDGKYNSFFGKNAGRFANTVSFSTFLGTNAGYNATSSVLNTYVGNEAGYNNQSGSANTAIGQQAGYSNQLGSYNTFLGQSAGYANTGYSNTMLGQNAGYNSSFADFNVFIGERSAYNAATGSENVVIGSEAGLNLNHGDNNVLIGHKAGKSVTGSGNVYIGNLAGELSNNSNRLFIDNDNNTFPLIGGNFSNNQVYVNNSLAINSQLASANLDVDGNVLINKSFGNNNFIVRAENETAIATNASANRVGIGHNSPAYTLHVRDGNATANTYFGLGNTEYFRDGNGTISLFADFDPVSTFTLDMGGAPYYWDDILADNFINISDMRFKKNVKPMNYGLKEVLAMETYSYRLKEDPFKENKIGLSAQNILSLIPEAVKTENHELIEGTTDEFRKVELEQYGLKYNSLIPVLVKAIQEQQEQIEELKLKIGELRRK